VIARGTKLKPGCFYRIVEISPADPDPTLRVGDVVHCEPQKRRALDPDPDGVLWFADYQGPGEGYGTLITGLEELPTIRGVA
jgi:hypothetical protein